MFLGVHLNMTLLVYFFYDKRVIVYTICMNEDATGAIILLHTSLIFKPAVTARHFSVSPI